MSFGREIGLDDLEASSIILGETAQTYEKKDRLNTEVLL